MIVQSAAEGDPHFVIMQVDHARACGEFVGQFGNATFATPEPLDLLTYVVAHHDEGWREVDGAPQRDPETALPYNLTKTPVQRLIAIGSKSPDFNVKWHPFCGVISSMHTYGLYHGRYGLSDKFYIDTIAPEYRGAVAGMVQGEVNRQNRLKVALRANPDTAGWAEHTFLFYHYKLLQFFDTLGLYVHTQCAAHRKPTDFLNVPLSPTQDVTIHAHPRSNDVVALTPYPFRVRRAGITTMGRYLTPLEEGEDVAMVIRGTPTATQTVYFISGESP
ncbi:MAG TPA: DUF3891 family protein [Aggregatilineales bacterium]|nr:DUF3891 family protein [Anaerolineales bacterium]HRE47774.1 DUF3891 family protein [Aggregatilineales bacterium]